MPMAAICLSTMKTMLDIKEFGSPTRAWVGVTLDANVGLPVVKSVRPTSAAALGGFQRGDVITSIAGKQIPSYNVAVKAFYLLRAEQDTRFEVVGVQDHPRHSNNGAKSHETFHSGQKLALPDGPIHLNPAERARPEA